ncbi:MAG TPA: PilT/PilU family type 4a pilus ATPase [Vicinamibacterales bacterium]|nr:PilT/PilU family type 4a pilus ATPase [Vicinamibacterales bacterium]
MPWDDDPDALAGELNALVPEAPVGAAREAEAPPDLLRLQSWLEDLGRAGGSDLLLVAGAPASIRVDGEIRPLGDDFLDGDEIERAVLPAMPPYGRQRYADVQIADASLTLAGVGRFRVNLHRERGRAAATIRALPARVPRLSSLNLPPNIEQLTRISHGLVLIGGATGSGKTTTLAALVDEINRRDRRHIVTIEDPVEYEHQHARSLVEQVEVGVDAPDFPTALRAAVRQAPDVIVVGEMRDAETMRIAVAAAGIGHLVLTTLHTTDVAAAVGRIADNFPPERQPTIRQDLAMGLSAVLIQSLLPRVGGGRVPAAELLVLGYGARQHIRKNALQHLNQEITITRKSGSFTLEEDLAGLVKRGLVERSEALLRAAHPEELDKLLAGTGS